MRWLCAGAVVAGGVLCAASMSSATPDLSPSTAREHEVVVFEAPGCGHCTAFRDRLGASYQQSRSHEAAPLRYVDATRADLSGIGLQRDITIVPTIVLMHEGREIERLEGYPVPQLLFGMVRMRVGLN